MKIFLKKGLLFFFLLASILVPLAFAPLVNGQTIREEPIVASGNFLEPYAEPIIFLLIAIVFVITLTIVLKIGSGVLNVVFVSFMTGILLLGLSRLFLHLSDLGYYQLSSVTTHIFWHLIFYLSMLSFIWGGVRIKEISSSQSPIGFHSKDGIVLGALVVVSVGIFLIAQSLEPVLAPMLVGSFVDTFGLHHFIAVILAAFVAYYMYYIKVNWGQLLSVSVGPIIVFLSLMGAQHFWELLTESWKYIPIEEATGEHVEQLIVIPALAFLVIAMYRVKKVINAQTKA